MIEGRKNKLHNFLTFAVGIMNYLILKYFLVKRIIRLMRKAR